MKPREAVLLILSNGPSWAPLVVTKAFEDHAVKIGTFGVYPLLRRLEERGLLESYDVNEALGTRGGRPRRYYRLTEAGIRAAKAARA